MYLDERSKNLVQHLIYHSNANNRELMTIFSLSRNQLSYTINKINEMGYILPEALVEAGVQATFINHAEHPVTYKEMRKIVQRGKELGIKTLVCADSLEEGRAAALLEPTIIVCEPSELIGTGKTSDSCYE